MSTRFEFEPIPGPVYPCAGACDQTWPAEDLWWHPATVDPDDGSVFAAGWYCELCGNDLADIDDTRPSARLSAEIERRRRLAGRMLDGRTWDELPEDAA